MVKRQGSIQIVLLTSIVVLLVGSAAVATAIQSKLAERENYLRLENRYIAESGIELAAGAFLNYLGNTEYVLSYMRLPDGSYEIPNQLAPYILDEFASAGTADTVPLTALEKETEDYLVSIGCFDYMETGGIQIAIHNFNNNERFRLSQICVEPDFLLGDAGESGIRRSKISPIYLTVKARYQGGEVLCNIEVSNVYIWREAFTEDSVEIPASVRAGIDMQYVTVQVKNYQNYRTKGGGNDAQNAVF